MDRALSASGWAGRFRSGKRRDEVTVAPGLTLASASLPLGLAIHMGLAVALGIVVAMAMPRMPPRLAGTPREPVAVIATLIVGVWAVNFFVVLPVINPAFVTLVPYGASLASKVLFGFAAAFVFWCGSPATSRRPARTLRRQPMSKEMILMMHPTFGVLALIAAVWVFVETLNASEANVGRIRTAGLLTAVLVWLAYIVGGYLYVLYYGADKAIILGPVEIFAFVLHGDQGTRVLHAAAARHLSGDRRASQCDRARGRPQPGTLGIRPGGSDGAGHGRRRRDDQHGRQGRPVGQAGV